MKTPAYCPGFLVLNGGKRSYTVLVWEGAHENPTEILAAALGLCSDRSSDAYRCDPGQEQGVFSEGGYPGKLPVSGTGAETGAL